MIKKGASYCLHFSLLEQRKSTIITTNLSFDRWNEIFNDVTLTAALIDRLTHKSYVLNMNGDSYRIKETKNGLKKPINFILSGPVFRMKYGTVFT